jgi:hypothetical protein
VLSIAHAVAATGSRQQPVPETSAT